MINFRLWVEYTDDERALLLNAIEDLKRISKSMYFTGLPKPDQNWQGLLVYADWLEERGDPLGDFIRKAHRYLELNKNPQVQNNAEIKNLENEIFNAYKQFNLTDVVKYIPFDTHHIDRLDPKLDTQKLKSELVYYLYFLTREDHRRKPISYIKTSLLRLLHHDLARAVFTPGPLEPEVRQELNQLINHLTAAHDTQFIPRLQQVTQGGHNLNNFLKEIERMYR